MSTTTSDLSPRIRRCAVCKIDLKGRFVFVDDASEELFGHSREDLFGKSFVDFVGPADQDLITHIVRQRNHYESFFESTRVSLVGASGQLLPSTVVISLNYIAGNPVNFQLVMNTDPAASMRLTIDGTALVDEFLATVLNAQLPGEWNKVVAPVCAYTEAKWFVVYRIHPGELEPVAAASPAGALEPPLLEPPAATPLHTWLALSGEEYCFTDSAMVRHAIEKAGSAPNEYIVSIQAPADGQFLLRFVFSDRVASLESMERPIIRAQLASDLIQRAASPDTTDEQPSAATDAQAALDAVGSQLGLPYCIIETGGHLRISKPFELLFASGRCPTTMQEFLDVLGANNSPDVVDTLSLLLKRRAGGQERAIALYLEEGRAVSLFVTPVCLDQSTDQVCIVAVPTLQAEREHAEAIGIADQIGVAAALQSMLSAAHRTAERLAHQCYDQLAGDGNFHLESLSERIVRAQGMLSDVSSLLALIKQPETSQTVDLNLLVRRLSDQVRSVQGGPNPTVRFHNLPKITTAPHKLQAIVKEILKNAATFSGGKPAEVTVTGVVQDSVCVLEFADNGAGIPEKHLAKVTDFFFRVPDAAVLSLPGRGFGLAMVRVLMLCLNGTMEIKSTVSKGTTVTLKLPV
ncbi:MAG: ATP-binding protein [Candidatus Zixiibacteriota bacterium]